MATEAVIKSIVDKTFDLFIGGATRHIGYLANYGRNIAKIKDEVDKLKAELQKKEREIEIAKQNVEDIEEDVSNWMVSAKRTFEDMDRFLQGQEDKIHRRCFKWHCTNPWACYRFGREAVMKLEVVTSKTEAGNKFAKISHARRFEGIAHVTTAKYKPFESRKKTFVAIMETLRGDNFGVVGIYGMGGVGKSTMAEEIQQAAKRENIFDEVAVAVVSQNVKVSEIQLKLAGCLNLNFSSGDDEWNRAARLKARLMQGKKILVVLDDVWGPAPLDLMSIGLDFPTGHNGCKILLTSRSPDVCRKNNCPKPFEIEGLNPNEAWKLFKDTVGDLVDRGIEPIAQSVCGECGGLPLVIQAVASALNNKDLTSWKDAQRRFKNFTPQKIAGIDPKVFGLLKVSYDYLEDEEAKSCFLLCCLFPEDFVITIERLTFYAEPMGFLKDVETIEEARERVGTLLGVLKSASLLLPNQEHPDCCRMHDVIRDVAISIASTEEKYKFILRDGISSWPEIDSPELCKLISIRSANIIDKLPNVLECPKLHTLVLSFTEYSKPPLKLLETFLQKLKTELRVLSLYNVSLPSSVLSELTNLRMLEMSVGELDDISMIKGLEKLEMLFLGGWGIIIEIPLEFGQLKHLRLLDMTFCYRVKFIPAGLLSNLSCLEELYIPTFGRWDLDDDDDDEAAATSSRDEGATRRKNVSVVELSSLTHLTALATYFLKHGSILILPDAKVLEKLIRYKIGVGKSSDSIEPSPKLLRLCDHYHSIDSSNDGVLINLAERAERIDLENLKGLQKMFDRSSSGEAFEDLKYLTIRDIQDLEHLTFFKSLSNLRRLYVSDCPKLKYLFGTSIARGLLQLEELQVRSCHNMEEVIRTNNEEEEELAGGVNHHTKESLSFPRLKSLTLMFLPKLESFYGSVGGERTVLEGVCDNEELIQNSLFDSKVSFPFLEKVKISNLDSIRSIWENGSHVHELFSKLRQLSTSGNLVNMIPPTMLERLPNLKVDQLW